MRMMMVATETQSFANVRGACTLGRVRTTYQPEAMKPHQEDPSCFQSKGR